MTHSGSYHGGLIYLGQDDGALDRFCRIVSATLEDYGHTVERQSMTDTQNARVVSNQYHVQLHVDSTPLGDSRSDRLDDAAGLDPRRKPKRSAPTVRNRLSIALTPASDGTEDRDVSELLLVVMLYRMVDIYSSEAIEWLEPDVVLTIDQFLSAFAEVSPKRVRGRQQILQNRGYRFAPIDETEPDLSVRYDEIAASAPHDGEFGLIQLTDEEALALAFRNEPHPDEVEAMTREERAQNDIQRLTSWGMTGCLAFVATPVAISMAAVNLIRGEDFRLNTQVLSLTSALVVLQSTGAVASVMSYIPL